MTIDAAPASPSVSSRISAAFTLVGLERCAAAIGLYYQMIRFCHPVTAQTVRNWRLLGLLLAECSQGCTAERAAYFTGLASQAQCYADDVHRAVVRQPATWMPGGRIIDVVATPVLAYSEVA